MLERNKINMDLGWDGLDSAGKECMDVGRNWDLNVSIKKGCFCLDFHKKSVLPSGLSASVIFLITKTMKIPSQLQPQNPQKSNPKFLPPSPVP